MPIPEERFRQLQSLRAIQSLIGQTEDLYLDCKEWPSREDDAQRMIAKALCGFSNADGGVLLIGMEARSLQKDAPDSIQQMKPVADAVAVKAKIENLVGSLVEPPLQGVRLAHVLEREGEPSGFVLIYIPPTEGFPTRSRKHWNFCLRVSAGTLPMEYFQIADMFGRRRRPHLELWGEVGGVTPHPGYSEREFIIGITNSGRAIARFPSLRFRRTPGISLSLYGLDGNGQYGLPLLPSSRNGGWTVFGGGADNVVYPGTTLEVAPLSQQSKVSEWLGPGSAEQKRYFEEFVFKADLSADEVPNTTLSFTLPLQDFD
jgi:hypothetical protein